MEDLEFLLEDTDNNCRRDFVVYEKENNYYRKIVASYLNDLEEKGEEYKIKHIKKYYQIYNLLYKLQSIIFDKNTFEYTDKDLTTNDFYNFLFYVSGCIQMDIIRFIKLFKDDNFDNRMLPYEKIDKNNPKYLIDNMEEALKYFCIYKHFR